VSRAPAVPTRYGVRREELEVLLADEPRYRVDQAWAGLYEQLAAPDEMTTLPRALRARLTAALPPALAVAVEQVSDGGDTVKWLWDLIDGARVETVLMHYGDRSTVCVSTQAGCAMACGFCATGQAGFERHLTVGEIVEQVARAARRARQDGRRLSNVVYMGMGEPLANYDPTWGSVERVHGELGLSARHLTVSTVGLVPGIRRLAGEPLPVNLAVSLHAADDELRDELVPINRRYPLSTLMDACAGYLQAKGRRLSFEWALIDGVNDRDRDALQLVERARSLPLAAHVNLIPLNPTPGYAVRGTPMRRVRAFRDVLQRSGVNATIRRTRGTEIDAACGQLRAGHQVRPPAPTPVELARRP
jgi:23S rRNA (adenine2503-C2)-methyltransferase